MELLYPIPNATGVSVNVGQMVFASNGIGRVRLVSGTSPHDQIVRTKQEPVPNPLPSPIATPQSYGQYLTTRFAVSFTTLQPHTHYNAQVYTSPDPCYEGEPFPPGWSDIGSFTTQ